MKTQYSDLCQWNAYFDTFLSNVMWSNVVILMLYVYCIYILYIFTVQVHIQV